MRQLICSRITGVSVVYKRRNFGPVGILALLKMLSSAEPCAFKPGRSRIIVVACRSGSVLQARSQQGWLVTQWGIDIGIASYGALGKTMATLARVVDGHRGIHCVTSDGTPAVDGPSSATSLVGSRCAVELQSGFVSQSHHCLVQ